MTTIAPDRADIDGGDSLDDRWPALIRVPLPDGCLPATGCAETEVWFRRVYEANPEWRIELTPEGELIFNEYAGGDSADIATELGRQIGNWMKDQGGGGRVRDSSAGYWVTNAAGRDGVMMPDLSWVSPQQFVQVPAEQRRRAWHLCPALVVEIRSPGDSLAAQQQRMQHWSQLGAQLGWLIDPRSWSVWVYRPDHEPERLQRPDKLSGEDVMPGLVVECQYIWQMADDLASL